MPICRISADASFSEYAPCCTCRAGAAGATLARPWAPEAPARSQATAAPRRGRSRAIRAFGAAIWGRAEGGGRRSLRLGREALLRLHGRVHEALEELAARDELHHDEPLLLGLEDVLERDDVRVRAHALHLQRRNAAHLFATIEVDVEQLGGSRALSG